MGYSWVVAPELPEAVQTELGLLTEFADQGAAEAWLTTAYSDLAAAGAREVSLYEGNRLVYGPMSLQE